MNSRSYQIIFNLIKNFEQKSKTKLYIALSLSIITGLIELLTVSSFNPIIKLILKDFYEADNIVSPRNFLLNISLSDEILIFAFVFLILSATGLRCLTVFYNAKLSAYIGKELSIKIYKKSLRLPLIDQFKKNTSETIPAATVFIDNTTDSLFFFLQIITCSIISLGIVISLFLTNLELTIGILFFICFIYLITFISTRKKLNQISKTIQESSIKEIKIIRESFGLIRDVILENLYDTFIDKFSKYTSSKRNAKASTVVIGTLPKYIVEGLIIISLILASIIIVKLNIINPQELFPILGVYGIATQRILPLIQQIFNNITFIRSRSHDIETVVNSSKDESNLKIINPTKNIYREKNLIKSFKSLEIKNLHFNYQLNNDYLNILDGIDLTINAGNKIGFIGETGSGKSTLLDIIMSLLPPLEGSIYINKIKVDYANYNFIDDWKSLISHVPQEIYLADTTIADNITFNSKNNSRNLKYLEEISRICCLEGLIKSTEKGFNTFVGEKGVRLSGGQRQRIGIARALYKKSEILILDEATSSLDTKTEAKLIKAIHKYLPKTTILMVAHRLSTLQYCDYIYSLKNGSIEFKKTPSELNLL